ncbi:hypothetical protein Pmani_028763 [Petrolisthes manimaculis]|uniref:Uncharacterized protein n=1 Tax=Petrolisthes manimaculis TaxID=1843537 RepID=A0AAE1P1F6_9EUCA|nr:hypothetical protein Pmani_028763 [Petrolisthes manimaculis]
MINSEYFLQKKYDTDCPWLKECPQSQVASKARRIQVSNSLQSAETTRPALNTVDPETRSSAGNPSHTTHLTE